MAVNFRRLRGGGFFVASAVASVATAASYTPAVAAEPVRQVERISGGSKMTEADALMFVTRFEQAWASRRGEDFAALWHPDGRLVYPFASREIRGDEVPLLNAITTKNAPHLTWRLIDWTHRGNIVVVEWESSNIYDGQVLTWRGMDKFTLRDGRIQEEIVYADTAPLQARRRGEKFPALIMLPDP